MPVKDLRLSPINYRTKLGPPEKFKQLCDSVAAKGVLQPITIRPAKGAKGYEVIFGNRRFAAAQRGGLETILAVVRDVPDADVLELQVIENAEREDPSPLEEARAFERLVEDHGRTVQQIAERINRTPTYVAQRLKLLKLSKEVREALDGDKVTLAVALLIARVPDPKLQAEALDDILEGKNWDGTPMTADEARKLLEERFLLRLDQAPFDITDATLVPKAGACTACPRRTGQQRELFPDVKSPDLCTDPVCHRSKLDALWKLRVKEAANGGQPVLDGKDGEEAVNNRYGGKYQRLDAEEWVGNKRKTVRQILGKDKPPVFLARDTETGAIAEVVRRADVQKVIAAKEPKPRASARESSFQAEQRRREAKLKIRRAAIRLALAEALEKGSKLKSDDVLELVVRAFAARCWNEVQRAILDDRGITTKGNVETAILKLAKDCAKVPGDLLGLGLELALRSGAPWHDYANTGGGIAEVWRDGLKLAGVKFEKHEKAAAEAAKAAKKAKGTKGKAPPAPALDDQGDEELGDEAPPKPAKKKPRKPATKSGKGRRS